MATEAFSISVSPDERWLAYAEWAVPKAQLERLPRGVSPLRISTMDLATGEILHHDLNSVPAETLGFQPDESGWRWTIEIIQERFRPPGWRGQEFWFQPYYNGTHLGLNPSSPGVRVVDEPHSPGTCSDCPPMTSVWFRDRTWDLLSNDISVAVSDGAVITMYFVGEGPYRTNLILRLRQAGDEELVIERAEKPGVLLAITCVRVSPDERYLAYVVNTKKQEFLAGPQEELLIRELKGGREKRIARYGYIGNLIWSPDSKRLYFAGGEYSSDSAVRVVDVSAVFER